MITKQANEKKLEVLRKVSVPFSGLTLKRSCNMHVISSSRDKGENRNSTCAMSRWLLGWQEMHCRKKATVAFSKAVLCCVVSPPDWPEDAREKREPKRYGCDGDRLPPDEALPTGWQLVLALALEWHSRNSNAVHKGLTSGPPNQSFMGWLLPTSVRKRRTGAASSAASGGRFVDVEHGWYW